MHIDIVLIYLPVLFACWLKSQFYGRHCLPACPNISLLARSTAHILHSHTHRQTQRHSLLIAAAAAATQTQCVHFSGASGEQLQLISGPQMGQAKSKGLRDHGGSSRSSDCRSLALPVAAVLVRERTTSEQELSLALQTSLLQSSLVQSSARLLL